jgi:hypothetical protein
MTNELDVLSEEQLETLLIRAKARDLVMRTKGIRRIRKTVIKWLRVEALTLSEVFPEIDLPSSWITPIRLYHPTEPEIRWNGKGRAPAWARAAICAGHSIEDLKHPPGHKAGKATGSGW